MLHMMKGNRLMTTSAGKPYANTRLVQFLDKRITEMRPRKTQTRIATEAGFKSVNMLAMIKSGASRLPLDRVQSLARALECDRARLFNLAVEQMDPGLARMIQDIYGLALTKNEIQIVELIRDVSGHSDPHLTRKLEKAIREVFEQ